MARNTGLRPGQLPGAPFAKAKMTGGDFDRRRTLVERLLSLVRGAR